MIHKQRVHVNHVRWGFFFNQKPFSLCLFAAAGYGPRFSWRKVGRPLSKTSQCDYKPHCALCNTIQLTVPVWGLCPLLLQITHPIRCTTTNHVTTLTIHATAPARVWWPRISARSFVNVSPNVSPTFFFFFFLNSPVSPTSHSSLHKQQHKSWLLSLWS